jgi:hypothetical protein
MWPVNGGCIVRARWMSRKSKTLLRRADFGKLRSHIAAELVTVASQELQIAYLIFVILSGAWSTRLSSCNHLFNMSSTEHKDIDLDDCHAGIASVKCQAATGPWGTWTLAAKPLKCFQIRAYDVLLDPRTNSTTLHHAEYH